MAKRISIHEYFLRMAELVGERATCPRKHVGAVITKNGHVIATGYNGSPSGLDHCTDKGCILENDHCVRVVHAEMNAILQAAKYGHSVDGGTLYTSFLPCIRCTNCLINAGIKSIYVREGRDDKGVFEAFFKAKVLVLAKTSSNTFQVWTP